VSGVELELVGGIHEAGWTIGDDRPRTGDRDGLESGVGVLDLRWVRRLLDADGEWIVGREPLMDSALVIHHGSVRREERLAVGALGVAPELGGAQELQLRG